MYFCKVPLYDFLSSMLTQATRYKSFLNRKIVRRIPASFGVSFMLPPKPT